MTPLSLSSFKISLLMGGLLLLLLTPQATLAFLLPKIIRQGRRQQQQQQPPPQQLPRGQPQSPPGGLLPTTSVATEEAAVAGLRLFSTPPKRLTVTEQLKYSPNRWKNNGEPLEPGFGGIWPGDPNAKTYKVTVKDPRTGTNYTMDVPEDRYIFFAFEDAGVDLPLANGKRMCRNGCCTTCAVKLEQGNVKMEAALGLLRDMKKKGYALTCCSLPRSDIVCELQDEDEVYIQQWGETFESGGVEWGGFLPEDD